MKVYKLPNFEVIGNVWFISDPHFFHEKIIEYADRPFKDVREMNETIIRNINDKVKEGDTLFCLGDVGFGSNTRLKKLISKINGKKILIRGNHDRSHETMLNVGFGISVPNLMWREFYMIHNAHRVGDNLFNKSMKIVLSGHSHSKLKYNFTSSGRRVINLSLDAWDFKPVSMQEILDCNI